MSEQALPEDEIRRLSLEETEQILAALSWGVELFDTEHASDPPERLAAGVRAALAAHDPIPREILEEFRNQLGLSIEMSRLNWLSQERLLDDEDPDVQQERERLRQFREQHGIDLTQAAQAAGPPAENTLRATAVIFHYAMRVHGRPEDFPERWREVLADLFPPESVWSSRPRTAKLLRLMTLVRTILGGLALPVPDAAPAEAPLPARRRSAIEPLPDFLKFPADRIHYYAMQALPQVEQWRNSENFHRAYTTVSPRRDFAMQLGFRVDPGEAIWTFLRSRGELAIKAHYALMHRLYEQTGGLPGQWVQMDINQFCADLGFKPHHKGGFKRDRKREALGLLEVMTTVEISVRYRVPNSRKVEKLDGPLWTRGLQGSRRDQYGDLYGQAREGDPSLWDPVGFTYSAGPFFADRDWRRRNQFLGLIGSGLMKLRTDKDQTAIRIGGYLGALGRFQQYRTRRLRVETLLARIGMARSYSDNPSKLEARIEGALSKLVEVGIIAGWTYTEKAPDDEPDMDDPEDLAALADLKETPWRRKTLEIEWPEALLQERERLEAAERKALAAETKRGRDGGSEPGGSSG